MTNWRELAENYIPDERITNPEKVRAEEFSKKAKIVLDNLGVVGMLHGIRDTLWENGELNFHNASRVSFLDLSAGYSLRAKHKGLTVVGTRVVTKTSLPDWDNPSPREYLEEEPVYGLRKDKGISILHISFDEWFDPVGFNRRDSLTIADSISDDLSHLPNGVLSQSITVNVAKLIAKDYREVKTVKETIEEWLKATCAKRIKGKLLPKDFDAKK